MSSNYSRYRLVCRMAEDLVSVSDPLRRDVALAMFAVHVATGGYGPDEARRAVVLSEEEFAKTRH